MPLGSRRYGPPPGLVCSCQHQHIRDSHGLKVSLFSDGSFKKSEIRAMAEKWVQVEAYPNIIDVEVDEALDIL